MTEGFEHATVWLNSEIPIDRPSWTFHAIFGVDSNVHTCLIVFLRINHVEPRPFTAILPLGKRHRCLHHWSHQWTQNWDPPCQHNPTADALTLMEYSGWQYGPTEGRSWGRCGGFGSCNLKWTDPQHGSRCRWEGSWFNDLTSKKWVTQESKGLEYHARYLNILEY